MTNVYTTSYTLDAIKRRALIPGTGRITETDLIGFVNDATQDYIVPILMAAREGFLHATYDQALVVGQTVYNLPSRAAAERLVRVLMVDGGGFEYPFARIETGRRDLENAGFELTDNTIVLWNLPSNFVTLRIVYFCEPNRLVDESAAAQVTALTSTTVTVDAAPTTFTTSAPLDFIAGVPGFRWRAQDKTPTAVNGNVLTFSAVPSSVAVGDYVALAGETPIVQIPKVLRPLVEQRAVVLALEALGDGRLTSAQAALDRMEKRLVAALTPRVPSSPRVINNRYTPGTLRRNIPQQFR